MIPKAFYSINDLPENMRIINSILISTDCDILEALGVASSCTDAYCILKRFYAHPDAIMMLTDRASKGRKIGTNMVGGGGRADSQ